MARRARTAIAEPRGERPQASVAELEARIVLQLVQKRFQFGPVPSLARNKFLEVDDHVPKWSDGALA